MGVSTRDGLSYWLDEEVDRRVAELRVEPALADLMMRETEGMDAREELAYEKAISSPASARLFEAVMGDIRRRDAGELGGWEPMRACEPPLPPAGFSSFRIGHACLVGLIGCDYDGYADSRTGSGDAAGMARLIDELAHMAAEAYANLPARYWPLDVEGGCWLVLDTMGRMEGSRVRVPLDCLCCDASDLDGDVPDRRRASLMTTTWWARFKSARAEELESGLVVPLPAAIPARMIRREEDGDGMDGGAMMSCAEALRRWESSHDAVPGMAADGDIRGLCSVVDSMVSAIASEVLLTGWRGNAE